MRYIDADKLKKLRDDVISGKLDIKTESDLIDMCPTEDVVKVVRCENCKYFIPDGELDHNEYPNIIEADGLCDNSLKFTYADDFCSCGEKK